jgi:hypothetical protein
VPAPLRTDLVRLTVLVELLVPFALVLLAAILLGLRFGAVPEVEDAGALRAVLGVLVVPLEGGFFGGGVLEDILIA